MEYVTCFCFFASPIFSAVGPSCTLKGAAVVVVVLCVCVGRADVCRAGCIQFARRFHMARFIPPHKSHMVTHTDDHGGLEFGGPFEVSTAKKKICFKLKKRKEGRKKGFQKWAATADPWL